MAILGNIGNRKCGTLTCISKCKCISDEAKWCSLSNRHYGHCLDEAHLRTEAVTGAICHTWAQCAHRSAWQRATTAVARTYSECYANASDKFVVT